MKSAANIYRLGTKELRSFARDPVLAIFIAFAFSIGVYTAARGKATDVRLAPIAVVDEDRSPLSARIVDAFYPPYFQRPAVIDLPAVDRGMDTGRYTFVLNIPPDFQRDVLAYRQPAIQLNIDATKMSQSFIGAGYIQGIIDGETREYLAHQRGQAVRPVELASRTRFNPTLSNVSFSGIMEFINNITMLSVILTGAALIREREHGTVEHLLAMPLTPFEIMAAKVWANGLIVLIAAALSLHFVIRTFLGIPVGGSVTLFLLGTVLHLFSTTALGIFLGTVARSMPQLGLLMMLIMLPLQILSGAATPRESMPQVVQYIMNFAPTTYFVSLAQAILYRGAGLDVVWPDMLALLAIGTVLFAAAHARFRRMVTAMQR